MTLTLGIVLTAVLFIIGAPVYIAFGLGGLVILLFYAGMSVGQLSSLLFDSMSNFVLLAVPLFVLAGNLMAHGRMGTPLVEFITSLVPRVPGGLAVSSIIACTFVGALTGAVPAALAAVGLVMFPAMIAKGYDRGFSGGVLMAGSNLGFLIPPSIGFILYGFLVSESVAKLFIAGIFPGLLLAAALAITAALISKRKKYPATPAASWKERRKLFVKALPGLFMPVIILGGIYSGTFTPTEAAAVACVYCFLTDAVTQRGVNWTNIWASLRDSVQLTAFVMVLLGGAIMLGKAFALAGFSQAVTSFVTTAGLSQMGFVLVLAVVLIVLGFIMEVTCLMFLVIPLILPTVVALDINLIYLGVVFIVSILVGIMTPPMAVHLYTTAGMFDIPVEEVMRGVLPFLVVTILVLIILVLFPEISLWLPGFMASGR